MGKKNKDLEETFWYTQSFKDGLVNFKSKVKQQNNTDKKVKGSSNVPLAIITILLLIILVAITIFYFIVL